MKSKFAIILLSLLGTNTFAQTAQAPEPKQNPQYYTTCSGKDDKGNKIEFKILDLDSANDSDGNLINSQANEKFIINLKINDTNYKYETVNANGQDVYMDFSSKENGGIKIHTDGDGVVADGTIGQTKSKFKAFTCTAGPDA